MIRLLTDSIENAIDVADEFFNGYSVDKRKVAKLAADGLTVGAIAATLGIGASVVEAILEDNKE